MLLPPLFITYEDNLTYITAAAVVMIIGAICALFMIPAMREDMELIDRFIRISEEEEKKESFLQTLKFGIRQKNFSGCLMVYLAQMV